MNDWVGIVGRDPKDRWAPVIDEKLDWRRLDRFEPIAKAIAIVNSFGEVYGEGGVRVCTYLVRGALIWACGVLEQSAPVRLENGLCSLQRNMALRDCREWIGKLNTFTFIG